MDSPAVAYVVASRAMWRAAVRLRFCRPVPQRLQNGRFFLADAQDYFGGNLACRFETQGVLSHHPDGNAQTSQGFEYLTAGVRQLQTSNTSPIACPSLLGTRNESDEELGTRISPVFMRGSGPFSVSCSLVPGISGEPGNENRYRKGSPRLPAPSRSIFPASLRTRRAFRLVLVLPSTASPISGSVFVPTTLWRYSKIPFATHCTSASAFVAPRDSEWVSGSNSSTV